MSFFFIDQALNFILSIGSVNKLIYTFASVDEKWPIGVKIKQWSQPAIVKLEEMHASAWYAINNFTGQQLLFKIDLIAVCDGKTTWHSTKVIFGPMKAVLKIHVFN